MEIEEEKLETLTDSANTYGGKSKHLSSWVNSTQGLVLKTLSVLGTWMPTDNI